MDYWISDGFKQQGPFPLEELPRHGLKRDWLVWCEGMDQWVRADTVPQIRALLETPTPVPRAGTPESVAVAPPSSPTLPRVASSVRASSGLEEGTVRQPIPTAVTPTSPQAIASLICGVLSLVFLAGFACVAFIPMLLAILLGHGALSRIRNGTETGRGLAVAGLVLGYIVLAVHVLGLIILVLFLLFAGAVA